MKDSNLHSPAMPEVYFLLASFNIIRLSAAVRKWLLGVNSNHRLSDYETDELAIALPGINYFITPAIDMNTILIGNPNVNYKIHNNL